MWVVSIAGNVTGIYDTWEEAYFASMINFGESEWTITET